MGTLKIIVNVQQNSTCRIHVTNSVYIVQHLSVLQFISFTTKTWKSSSYVSLIVVKIWWRIIINNPIICKNTWHFQYPATILFDCQKPELVYFCYHPIPYTPVTVRRMENNVIVFARTYYYVTSQLSAQRLVSQKIQVLLITYSSGSRSSVLIRTIKARYNNSLMHVFH